MNENVGLSLLRDEFPKITGLAIEQWYDGNQAGVVDVRLLAGEVWYAALYKAAANMEQISSAINMIVQQTRMSDGSRKVTYITEVTGMEGQVITMQDIFVYKQTGVDERGKVVGKFVATGFIPRFVEGLQARGIKLPKGIFRES